MKNGFTDIKTLNKSAAEVLLVGGAKQLKFAGFKVSPTKPTDDQLAKINRFTRRPFTADELYVGQMRLANNAIDRDSERFSEEVIQRFAKTAIRRTLLLDHDKKVRDSAAGKFFDVELEKMPLQQAIAETGENLVLPDGIVEVLFHSPWFYIPVAGIDAKELVKIDAGIYDFASIGFRAEKLVPVMDKEGKPLFWEYRGSGDTTEMTEGSLVYLGAQYGMAVKSADNNSPQGDISDPPDGKGKLHEGGERTMDKFMKMLARLFPGKTFTEDGAESELAAAMNAETQKAVDAATAPLNERIKALEPLEQKVTELTPLAADGKAYRDGLVLAYCASKAKLGEVTDKPEEQEAIKKMAEGFPVDFLKSEVAYLGKRVDEKFPAGSQLSGESDPEKRDKSKGADGKANPLKPKQK